MAKRNMIVVGASAGGLEAMRVLLTALPRDFDATLFFTMHVSPNSPSVLPQLLRPFAPVEVSHPLDRELIRPRHIYLAPPDHHMVIEGDHVLLTKGPRENGSRPAINPLFRTAAETFGPRTIGVILTGMLDDGCAGLFLVKRRGGYAIVQSPEEASFPSMPRNAIESTEVDEILPLKDIGRRLGELIRQNVPDEPEREAIPVSDRSKDGLPPLGERARAGTPTSYTCPDCGGSLNEVHKSDKLSTFECHVGHAYGAHTLAETKNGQLEMALWTALRTLDETASFYRRMASRSLEHGRAQATTQFSAQAEEAERRGHVVRQALFLKDIPRLESPPVPVARASAEAKDHSADA